MDYGNKPLHTALYEHGLSSKVGAEGHRILVQSGREIGKMTASVGWCLIRLLDNQPTDTYPRFEVEAARQLLAGIDRR